MARRIRFQLPGVLRHVMARGNGKMPIFLDDQDYRRFVFLLGEAIEGFDIECWNYCVMPNHYHLTIRPRQPNLSTAMKELNSEYAQWWNRQHGRVGHTFQGRFKDQVVEEDSYALELSRYVALNPVRAGLVQRPEDWRWSSSGALLGLKPAPSFLSVPSTLRLFGDAELDVQRRRVAQFVLAENADDTASELIRSAERVLGAAAFKVAIRRDMDREIATPADADRGTGNGDGGARGNSSAQFPFRLDTV
jgi:REP element-mobilizing transposase RayT